MIFPYICNIRKKIYRRIWMKDGKRIPDASITYPITSYGVPNTGGNCFLGKWRKGCAPC